MAYQTQADTWQRIRNERRMESSLSTPVPIWRNLATHVENLVCSFGACRSLMTFETLTSLYIRPIFVNLAYLLRFPFSMIVVQRD